MFLRKADRDEILAKLVTRDRVSLWDVVKEIKTTLGKDDDAFEVRRSALFIIPQLLQAGYECRYEDAKVHAPLALPDQTPTDILARIAGEWVTGRSGDWQAPVVVPGLYSFEKLTDRMH